MTIIAVKGRTMAADSMAVKGDVRTHLAPGDTKIIRAPDGSLVGSCGNSSDCWTLRQWVLDGMSFAQPPSFAHAASSDVSVDWLWLKTDGTAWRGDARMTVHPLLAPTTIGCSPAWQFTEAAMFLGLSAYDAVQFAITHCQNIGGAVQVESL